jgi:hypothetical protein
MVLVPALVPFAVITSKDLRQYSDIVRVCISILVLKSSLQAPAKGLITQLLRCLFSGTVCVGEIECIGPRRVSEG